MLKLSNSYVQLDRRFSPFTDEFVTEDVIVRSYSESLFYARSTLSWEELLHRRLTVVLGEQGSGKTEEFRRQAERLCERGEAAFFIPLENLVNNELRKVLSESDERRFSEWFKFGEAAVFFLDSVDESKLVKPGDFEVALRQFAKDVTSTGLRRAKIVLSSRVSKWSPATDAERVARCLDMPQSRAGDGDSSDEEFDKLHVVRLLPLDESMVLCLLNGCGFKNASRIKSLFDDRHLWGFVRRPVDALRYARSVEDGIEVESLTDVLVHDVAERLRESPDREQNDPLTPTQALGGARTLAAAVVFTRRRALLVRDPETAGERSVVDPVKCLSTDWSPSRVQSLLGRSLFDGASLGTIRFHDPRVRDFLAAQWLQDRFSQGCPIETVKELLCAEFPDGLVVREEMESVLAWVACGDSYLSQEARTWVLKASPELFFSQGDPGCLPIDYRRQLLDAYIDRCTGCDYSGTATNPESLARFAENAFDPDLNRIAADSTLGLDARLLALRLMRHGRLTRCSETALTLATDSAESIELRTSAIAAIRDASDDLYRERLAQWGRDAISIPEKLLGILIEAVFPTVASADDVASFVDKTESKSNSEERTDRSHWLVSHFEECLTSRNALDLLLALAPLAEQTPRVTLSDIPLRLSVEFQWLGPWFPPLLGNAVREPTLSPTDFEVVARVWAWLEEFSASTNGISSLPDDFVENTKQHPQLRREYFWLRYQDHLDRREGEPRRAFQFLGFRGHGGFEASATDMDWLQVDVERQSSPTRKKMALNTWIDIWQRNGRLAAQTKRVRSVVSGDQLLTEQLGERLRQARFSRLKHFWYGIVRQKLLDGYTWRRRWWSLQQRYGELRDTLWLHMHLRLLRSGKRADVLSKLAREAVKGDGSTRVAPMTWDGLRKKRGRRIADAVSAGCRQVWMDYEPHLPHEREAANTNTSGDRAGLSGLSTGIVSGEINIVSLSESDVEKAIRYAATELNGFPEWFSPLVECHSDIVRGVLSQAVSGEWNWTGDHVSFGVLHDIRWGEATLRELLAGDIVELLEKSEPSDPRMLSLVLQCLVDAPADVLQRLSELSTRTLNNCPTHGARFTHWCVAEIQLNPSSALSRLESLSPLDARDRETTLEFVATLSGEDINSRSQSFRHAQPWSPEQMKRLLLQCHRLIKTVDDIKRQGAYSPTSRDHAQRFRDSLITQLANNESSETPSVLRSLLNESELSNYRDYVLDLIARRRRIDAASAPWKESDVVNFATEFETEPKSGEELYLITRRRLTQLRYDVEESDNSLRDEVRADHDEKALCRWIARNLSDHSRGRYVTTLEVEIDQAERPDVRTEHPGLPPVPIEVKWAENWSYNKLVERLENQLFGQYLRARDNRYGFFLLGYADAAKKEHWKKDTGELLTFSELVSDLQSIADGLVECSPAVNAVTVIGIDYRNPKS